MAAVAIWYFKNSKFLTVGMANRVELRHRTKCRQNCCYCSRDMVFWDFTKWRPPPSWISKFRIFNGRTRYECRTASPCQISSKSLEPRPRYGSFNIMQVYGLKMPIHAPFWWVSGAHLPRPNPEKIVLGLNHVIWAIKREYRSRGSSWALEREKSTGQERQKVAVLYFTHLWRSPHWSDVHENCLVGDVLDVITCAKFQNETFRGYDFTGERIFHFLIDFRMHLTTVQRYCSACEQHNDDSIMPASKHDKR